MDVCHLVGKRKEIGKKERNLLGLVLSITRNGSIRFFFFFFFFFYENVKIYVKVILYIRNQQ